MIIVLFPRDAICLVSRGGVGGLLGCLVGRYGILLEAVFYHYHIDGAAALTYNVTNAKYY